MIQRKVKKMFRRENRGEEVHEHPEYPCKSCDGIKFRIDKGDYVCTLCFTVNPELEEEGFNEHEVSTQRVRLNIGTGQTQKKKKEKLAKIQATASRPWLSIEACNCIYQGCLVEVINFKGIDEHTKGKQVQF